MEEGILKMIFSENAVTGTAGAAALAILYKVWRILKTDRKVDDLDNKERDFREELRKEIADLRQAKQRLEEANQKLIFELSELRASFAFCQRNHPRICPVFQRQNGNAEQGNQNGNTDTPGNSNENR